MELVEVESVDALLSTQHKVLIYGEISAYPVIAKVKIDTVANEINRNEFIHILVKYFFQDGRGSG